MAKQRKGTTTAEDRGVAIKGYTPKSPVRTPAITVEDIKAAKPIPLPKRKPPRTPGMPSPVPMPKPKLPGSGGESGLPRIQKSKKK